MPESCSTADVVIAGAGLAGTTAALLLGQRGFRVALVDPFAECPPCFKAEKIESDQLDYFERFGLLDTLRPVATSIPEVLEAKDGRIMRVQRLRQHGVRYHEMVNALRARAAPGVEFHLGRVRDVATEPEVQTVRLADGCEIRARLVLMATGAGTELASRVGPPRQWIQKEQSVCFGFDVARSDGRPFPFASVTYYPEGFRSRLGYLTLFLVRDVMRANLFTFWSQREELSRMFVKEPETTLARVLPGLGRLVGELEITSRVESARIDLFRVQAQPQAGLVPVADAYQSVCPTTGSGLSKVLTDVDVLGNELVPEWLSTPGLGPEKTARFYGHPRKQAVDLGTLESAAYRRRVSLDTSLRWRLHRARVYSSMWLGGWPRSRMFTRKLTA